MSYNFGSMSLHRRAAAQPVPSTTSLGRPVCRGRVSGVYSTRSPWAVARLRLPAVQVLSAAAPSCSRCRPLIQPLMTDRIALCEAGESYCIPGEKKSVICSRSSDPAGGSRRRRCQEMEDKQKILPVCEGTRLLS